MSEHFLDQDAPATPSSAAQEPDMEDEEEEEIDELVSEPDLEPPSRETRSPSPVERGAGTSLLPVPKMEEILLANAHPNMLALSREALFLVSTATEEFIKKMSRSGLIKATADQRSTVSYSDMSYVTQQYQEFMFLQELIPAPISLAEALELRQEREKEHTLHDPALTIRENLMPASSPPPSAVVRQLPPVPPAASTTSAPRPTRTRTKTAKPKPQPVADPNGAAPPHPDRSGVPQHMQHQMQMQVNGDFTLPGGVSMQVDMTNASAASRSSSRSTKGKRKETKASAPAKRRKTALETSTTATPASSVGTSPPVSRSRSTSTSASAPPAGYIGNPQPAYHPPSLDYIADRSMSASSSSSRKKKDINPTPVPSHLLDPALTNGNAYPSPAPQDPASSHRSTSPAPPAQWEYTHANQPASQWPTGNPYPSTQPLGLNGGAVGRTIYSTSSRSANGPH